MNNSLPLGSPSTDVTKVSNRELPRQSAIAPLLMVDGHAKVLTSSASSGWLELGKGAVCHTSNIFSGCYSVKRGGR